MVRGGWSSVPRLESQRAEPLLADDVTVLVAVGRDPGDEVAIAHRRLLLFGDRLEHGLGGDLVANPRIPLDLELGVRRDDARVTGVGQELRRGRPDLDR